MSDDTTTDDDRVDRLTNIIEQQNERINQLEDVVQEQAQAIWPNRRQAMKATGAAALFGAGAIGGAAGAPGDDGDTVWGSDQNRDDYYVDEMDANTVSTDDVDINGPSDFDVLGPDGYGDVPVRLHSDPTNHALALQWRDDSANGGSSGYGVAGPTYVSENGEEVGHFWADNDNEISLYSRSIPLSETATDAGQFQKRWNVQAGEAQTFASYRGDSGVFLSLTSRDDSTVTYSIAADGSTRFAMQYDHDLGPEGSARFLSPSVGNDLLWFDIASDRIDWQGNSQTGLREVENPTPSDLGDCEWAWDATNKRWLYKDLGGTVHYFTPDGTL